MKVVAPSEIHKIRRVSRAELIEIVQKLMNAEGNEDEEQVWLQILADNVPHPRVSDLLYWPEKANQSAEDIINEAFCYRPFEY